MAAKQRALEEEIAAKNQALEEETAAKSREVKEESMAKSHTVDEEMTDVGKQQHVSDTVDACRPDSGLSQTGLPTSDPTETNASKETAPACNSQLHMETTNGEYTIAQDQATHNGDMVPEGVDHLKEATTPGDINLKLVDDVAGIGDDGKMIVDSDGLQNENFHPKADVDGLSTDAAVNSGGMDEMMTVDSNSVTAGVLAMKPDSSIQTIRDSGAPTVGNPSSPVTLDVNNRLVGDLAVASDSLNTDSGSAEGIIGDSSNKVPVPVPVGSGENVVSDSSDHAVTGDENTTVHSEIPADANVLASGMASVTGDMESS